MIKERHIKGYWSQKFRHREFFDSLAKKFNIKDPSDWSKISREKIIQNDGSALIFNYYDGSVKKALQSIYPEINWNNNWFYSERGHWSDKQRQRDFFDSISTKFSIKNSKDWGNITKSQIEKYGGASILKKYGGSTFRALKSIYPEWNINWFRLSKGYWLDGNNQRQYLDKLATSRNIKNPKEWTTKTKREMHVHRGASLLSKYGGSLFETLKTIYSDIPWKREWFHNLPKYQFSHWNSLLNQKIFVFEIVEKFGIASSSDWRKISSSAILRLGGRGFLRQYHGNILQALKTIFPNEEFSETKVNTQSIGQLHLNHCITTVFPDKNHNRPYVTLTYAQSLDGSITGEKGKPLTLSCEETMKLTHKIRSAHQGILVGVNTIIIDNPSLTVRYGIKGSNPKPVIMDRSLRTPLTSKLLTSNETVRPIIATTNILQNDTEKADRAKKLENAGAIILYCNEISEKIDLEDMLNKLSKYITSVMVEGGASIIQSFLEHEGKIIDKVLLTISPIFVGGVKGLQHLLPYSNKFKLRNIVYEKMGTDFVVEGELSQ